MTRKPNFWKCILGVTVLALLFIGTWASTNAPQSNAQDQAQKQGPTINAPPPPPPPGAPPAGIAHVFEIEGNVCNDSAEGTDWNDVNPPADPACSPGFVTGDPDGTGPIQLATFVIDTCPDDRVFTIGSSKDFNDIQGNWHSTIGSVPDKDEITHAYAAISVVPSTAGSIADETVGHRILTFGGDRFATNGDANIGLWFFQNAVSVDPVSGDFQGTHLNGDLFVVSAFTGGGGTSVIDVYEWVGSPLNGAAALCSDLGGALDNAGTLCKLPATPSKGFAIVNPADLSGACPGGGGFDWPYTTKGDRTPCLTGPCDAPKGSFYEGGLDLTDLGFANTCFSTFLLETRSSQTVDAILKDFALGSFDTCAVTISKTPATQSLCVGGSATYKYSVQNTGVSTLFATIVDDSGTPNDPSDDYDPVTGVLVASDPGGNPVELTLVGGQIAGSCSDLVPTIPCLIDRTKQFLTVPNPNPEINIVKVSGRLTSGGTIVKTATAQASTTVNPLPVCGITGDNVICHFNATGGLNTATFCGPDNMASYSWTGPGSFSASTKCITISTAGTYNLTITDANGCSSSCSRTLTVNENPTCNITGTNEICQFDASGNANTTEFCGPAGMASYAWSGPGGFTKTTQCTGSISTAGTYNLTITDANACSSSCSRTLTVNSNPAVAIATVACDLDGSIILDAAPTGGSGGYTYLWSTGETTQDITVTTTGTYTLVVTDDKGCVSAQASIRVGLCAGP